MTNNKLTSITLSGLVPDSKYTYQFTGAGANWPTILSNPTGVLYTNNSTVKTVRTNVHFCVSTGLCPSGAIGVLNYSRNNCISDITNLYSNLNFILKDYDTQEELYNDNIEVTCSGCLPDIIVNMPTSVSISNSNIYPMFATVSGLIPKQTYNYSFTGVDANWPVTLSSATGSIVAKDDTDIINCDVIFCPVTGMCEDAGKTVVSYNLDNNCIYGVVDPYVRLRLSLTPQSCSLDSINTDPVIVTCNNCLPRLTTFTPSGLILATANQNRTNITSVVSGLRVNETYTYEYQGVSSNWPTIISPVSGSFTATDASGYLTANLMFCSPKSICPSGTPGLFDYTLDSYAKKLLNNNVISTVFNLKVTPTSCDIPVKTSENIVLACSGCLPSFSYSSINFEDTPELLLSGACCTGMKTVSVNVSGAVPGDEYTYKFDSVSSGVEFAPATGYAYFDSDGGGYINTIMSSDLVASQQVVITCELTHADTQIKTIDFLAVKCSGACA